ncbi:hypothetical protein B296_00037735, partial [Ensete ventricosum]
VASFLCGEGGIVLSRVGTRRHLALFVSRREGGVTLSRAGTRYRLTSFVPCSVASRRETSDLMVPPGSGQSAYQYPVGLVCTACIERYSLKFQTLL